MTTDEMNFEGVEVEEANKKPLPYKYKEGAAVPCKEVKKWLKDSGYEGSTRVNKDVAKYLSGKLGKTISVEKGHNNLDVFVNISVATSGGLTDLLPASLTGEYIQSPVQTYEESIEIFEKLFDVIIKADPADEVFAKHCVYKKAIPASIKGVEYDSDFRVLRPINSEELKELENKFFKIVKTGKFPAEFSVSKLADALKLLAPIVIPNSYTKDLETLSARVFATNPEYLNKHIDAIDAMPSADLTGQEESQYPVAYLPHPDWFAPQLQQLQIKDVLTIFPQAEQEVLARCLGRAVVGANGTIQSMSRERISHGMRCFPLVYGDTEIGKSVLFKMITDVLGRNGYKVELFNHLSKQFGLGPIATSNIAYSDDLNSESLKSVITATLFKSIISNAGIKAEVKHQADIDVQATTMMFANVNDFTPHILYEADNGALNRLKVLATCRNIEIDERTNMDLSELCKDSPNLRTWQNLHWLSEKLDVSIDAVILKFLSLCAELFLSEIRTNTLELNTNYWSSKLRTILHEGFDESLASLLQFSWCIRRQARTVPNLDSSTTLLEAIEDLNFIINDDRANNIRNLIKADWESKDRRSMHIWVALARLDNLTVYDAAKTAGHITEADKKKPVEFAVKHVYSLLRLNSGFKLAANTANVLRNWKEARYSYKANDRLIGGIMRELARREIDCDALTNLRVKTSAKHLFESSYDRELHADMLNKLIKR